MRIKFYIVDDEIGIIKALQNIIELKNLGEVIGYNTEPKKAVDEILSLAPDIVLVDLLMTGMDGITLVEKIKSQNNNIGFVMISKVADKEMVEQAYNAGVEFFINKPVNIIEVVKVIENISDKIEMNTMMQSIKGIIGESPKKEIQEDDSLKNTGRLLGLVGMMGEKGTSDIQNLCKKLINDGKDYSKEILQAYADEIGDSSKNVEQRMRRAMKKGLANVAAIGIDDFASEVFQIYGNYVFDFNSIKDEMEYMKGRQDYGGRVNVSKFIDGLILYHKSV